MSPPREQRSLFGEILDWMLAPLLLLWPMSVALTWLVAQNIAAKPYDRELGELARLVASQVTVAAAASDGQAFARFAPSPHAIQLLPTDETDAVHYQVLGLRGELLSGERALPVPHGDVRATPGELRFRDDQVFNEPVRVAYIWLAPPAEGGEGPLVQVAETLVKRSRLATEIIKGVMLPQLVILPLAVTLVWFALARGIAPLNELQQRIRRRESHDLSPIDERDASEEVSPLVQAINDLLARLDQNIRTQKHFLADAAHQLKTPLAGLRTQAELAEREIDAGHGEPQALKRSLRHIALSSQRAAHTVNQLLALARAEVASQMPNREPVCLAELATDTVRDFVPRAMAKRIDLGYEGPDASEPDRGGLRVPGHPVLLRELVRNIVDNALQYTPAGGVVTVRVVEDPFGQVVVLQVEDSGPGVPPAERDKVFQPFYRALGTNVDGSGLGLAIVQEIAQHHNAEITLEDAHLRPRPGGTAMGPGLLFTVRFGAIARAVPPELG